MDDIRFAGLKDRLLTATRELRTAEFKLSQYLVEVDLTQLTDDQLSECERQVNLATKFSYEVGLNAFTNERWRREQDSKAMEEAVDIRFVEEVTNES